MLSVFMGMNAFIYVHNRHYGAWWGALPTFVGSCFGIFSLNKGCVMMAAVASSVGLVTTMVALYYDQSVSVTLNQLEACASIDVFATNVTLKNNVDYYGNEKYFKPSMECIEQEYKNQTDCYCVNGLSECTTFSGRTDCFDILDTYTNYVNMSVALLGVVFSFSFILCFVTCIITCLLRKDNKGLTLSFISQIRTTTRWKEKVRNKRVSLWAR